MGAAHPQMQILPDQFSTAESGRKCIATESLEDLDPPICIKDLLEEAQLFDVYPIIPGSEREAFLKYVETEYHGPNDRTTKVVLDGIKLDEADLGRGDGMDKVALWRRFVVSSITVTQPGMRPRSCTTAKYFHFVDLSGGGMWAEDATDEEEVITSAYYCLSQPDRIEICDDRRGVRDASGPRVQQLEAHFNQIYRNMLAAAAAKVQVAHSSRSIRVQGEVSDVSTQLGELITYEKLFDAMLAVLRRKVGSTKLEEGDNSFVGESLRPQDYRYPLQAQVRFSKDLGEMLILEAAAADSDPAWSRLSSFVLHREPLVVEGWEEDDNGNRVSTIFSARRLQEWVNEAIDYASCLLIPGVV